MVKPYDESAAQALAVEAQRLDFYGANLGLKLPTGERDVRNAEGAHLATGYRDYRPLPLYQRVNGVQLTADWAAVAGISTRF